MTLYEPVYKILSLLLLSLQVWLMPTLLFYLKCKHSWRKFPFPLTLCKMELLLSACVIWEWVSWDQHKGLISTRLTLVKATVGSGSRFQCVRIDHVYHVSSQCQCKRVVKKSGIPLFREWHVKNPVKTLKATFQLHTGHFRLFRSHKVVIIRSVGPFYMCIK